MIRQAAAAIALSLFSLQSSAALLSRASGQAYYDDVLDITWLQNANLADTNAFGVAGIFDDGAMDWVTAQEWIGAMNTAAYLGVSDWRLPTVTDTGMSGCDLDYTGTDCGYNVDLSTGEMAHMFYSTLGNTGEFDTSGSPTGCPPCLTNEGPFSNLRGLDGSPYLYWSGTTYAPDTSEAWDFNFEDGMQYHSSTDGGDLTRAWAVSSGDSLNAVPIPAAAWLFGGALAGLAVLRRRQATA